MTTNPTAQQELIRAAAEVLKLRTDGAPLDTFASHRLDEALCLLAIRLRAKADAIASQLPAAQPAPAGDAVAQPGVMTDERCDAIADATYTELRATGWNGSMGGLQWDRALIRAALQQLGKDGE